MAYNRTNNEYLVTWRGDDNTAPLINSEFEIFGQRLNAATGAAVGANDFRLSNMGPDGNAQFVAFNPAVVYNSTNQEYLVVWSGNNQNQEFEIFGQRLSAATGAAIGTNDFRLSDTGGERNFTAFLPAVAYNSTNNEYLVVWVGSDTTINEFDIFGQRINAATGAEVGVNDFRISDMGPDGNAGFRAFQTAVAYNITNNEYLVVWSGDDNTAPLVDDEREIFGQRLNATTGAAVGTNDFRISDMGPDGNTNFFAIDPAVAYNSTNNEYLVVWHGDDNTAPLVDNEVEIFGQRLNAATGTEVGTNDFRISEMGPDGDVNFRAAHAAVAYNNTNNEYLVVWDGNDNEREIFGQRLNAASGAAVGIDDFRISDMGPNGNPNFAALVPSVAYNSTNNEYLVVWSGDDNTAPLVDEEREIFGQRLDATGSDVGANDFRISDMGPNGNPNFAALVPSVAYNSTNNEYLVVWEGDDNTSPLVDDEFEIFGQQISATGGEVGTNDFRLSDMGPNGNASFDAEVPNVAYNSTNNLFLVVWDGLDNGGALGDGEKEIFGQRFEIGDFGDAPDSYATRLANNGAWHRLGTPLFLGAGVDGDNDGLPTANARGDDTTDSDDEDGVTIGVLSPGSTNTISVVASASGKLDAFVDFNRDGDFADLGEKIFQSMAVAAGSNSLSFSVPAGAKRGNTFARFRLSTAGGLSFGGRASDGEVEDYRVHVQEMRLVAQGNNVLFIRPVVDQPGTVVGNRMAGAWELPLQSFGPSEPIIVNAVDGDDKMTIPNAVNRSVFVDGGKGNDQFDAELDHDALAGGDWLISSAVRDWYWRLSHYALADLQSPDELIR